MTSKRKCLAAILAFLIAMPLIAEGDWVAKSNEYAQILLDLQAKYGPEGAGFLGIEGYDEEVFSLPLDLNEQSNRDTENAVVILREARTKETHPALQQDLDIMIKAGEDAIRGTDLNQKYSIPYFNLHQTIFQGVRSLLDDQIPEERRAAAVVRLNKYAGRVQGYSPIAVQAETYVRHFMKNESLMGPFKDDIEKDLGNGPRFIAGLKELFERYELTGWQEAYEDIQGQLATWEAFLRTEVMPRAREDFRLPPELYAFSLEQRGIDMTVPELTSRAKVAFREIQNEMQVLAAMIAKEKGFLSSDYRDVIRELKKKQFVGENILPHYLAQIEKLEKLIEEGEVISLPERDMKIRIATEAEAAQTPAPNMRPPRLIGNTGEMGEFVLPLKIPAEEGQESVAFDDFTYEAASWTLTVHEGRPGHELQFASIVEAGVSQARILYSFNSVNVEGWALYAEAEMKPVMPLEGQLISLQHRLLRAARAFLDPGLQLGEITRDEAFDVLEKHVVVSHPMALQEVERYTFRSPGQAPSYFCGYSRLMELRTDAERLLGERFNRRDFHDYILAQGLLPPSLLRKAVIDGFVRPRLELDSEEPSM